MSYPTITTNATTTAAAFNLTHENLAKHSSASNSHYPASLSSSSSISSYDDQGRASLFSYPLSVVSAASTAPDDADIPFQAADAFTGASVTVYGSLAQAARYSAVRAETERRRQLDSDSAAAAAVTAAVTSGDGENYHHYQYSSFFGPVATITTTTATTMSAVAVEHRQVGNEVDEDEDEDEDEDGFFSLG